MNKVVIVDETDSPIDLKEYPNIAYEDIYRVSVLWLTDIKNGYCLMTQRKWTKHNDPGKWMAAASGTIEENESYDENIVHEIEEEIGLKELDLKKGPKEFIDDGKHKFFTQWYMAGVDKGKVTIKIQTEEVESFDWVPIQNLIKELKNNPDKFVPSLNNSLLALGILEEN
ncbi:MAG TPA: NUDIX domain-containing protein [Candidatus Saccharimonadales bacterium]|jgi:isopentenyldiphosphate isomerase|nr:NUDIX domain-containing protein [Candidatus Saccharimonadales bacterium]